MPLSTRNELQSAPTKVPEIKEQVATGQLLPEHAIPFLIFLLCLSYLCIFCRYSSLEPDEGIVLEGAERILHGEVPYRDFFSFYTAGSFYLVAFLFRVFGDSFITARASLAVVGAICSVITYLLARRVCSREISIFAAILATVTGAAFRFLVLHNAYSTLMCCLALYAAVRFLETRQNSSAFATGSLASLTILFEQSKGAGLCLGLALSFLILRAERRVQLSRRSSLITFATGFLWPMVLTFVYFGAHHATEMMVQDWFWPLQHYTQANHVPYAYQNWSDHSREVIFHTGPMWIRAVKILAVSPGLLIPVLPLIALGVLIYWIVERRQKRDASAEARYYLLVCSVLSGLLVSVIMVRADVLHFMYLAPLWYVILAWILGAQQSRSRTLIAIRPWLTAYTGAAFGLLAMALLFATTGARMRLETRRGVINTSGEDTVIRYVQDHVAPREPLLIYPYLPLYNYLTGTRSPSRYDYLQPGMNTVDEAHEVIASLESQNVRTVLFEPWFPQKIPNSWPETSLSAIANDPVAAYILRNYRVCKTLNSPDGWEFQYMVRKQISCP